MQNAMIIKKLDNVIVAIEPIKEGETASYLCDGEEKKVTAREDIKIYHKLASQDIAEGQSVIKYGEKIGAATKNIAAGEHVHVHNMEGYREK